MNINLRRYVQNEMSQMQRAGKDDCTIVTDLSNDVTELLLELHVLTASSEEAAVRRYDGLIDRLLDNRQHARQLWHVCDKEINEDNGK